MDTLSLSQLRETLQQRGTPLSLSALSEFIKTGDIADQLQAGGAGNRRAFHPDVADILTAFFPQFKQAGGKLPQAPNMLRSFLKQRNPTGDSLVPTVSELPQTAKPLLLDGQVPLLTDEVFTAQQAADFLRVSQATVRRHVKPSFRIGTRPRWRKSDLLKGGQG